MTNYWKTQRHPTGWCVVHPTLPEEVYRFQTKEWADLCRVHLDRLTTGWWLQDIITTRGVVTRLTGPACRWDLFGGGELVVETTKKPSSRVRWLSWLLLGSKWTNL